MMEGSITRIWPSTAYLNGSLEINGADRIGARIDKKQTFSEKVTAVNKILAADHNHD